MTILCLDLGTQCGWVYKEGHLIESGTENFTPARGDSKGLRFMLFNRWLKEMALEVDLIAYERAHHRGGAATEVAYGFSTRVQEFASINDIDTMAVHTATIKKHATGSGKASKFDMLEFAIQTWPEQFEQKVIDLWDLSQLKDGHPAFDQADALCLMNYILSVV